jgi:hypothetical protein
MSVGTNYCFPNPCIESPGATESTVGVYRQKHARQIFLIKFILVNSWFHLFIRSFCLRSKLWRMVPDVVLVKLLHGA